MNKALKIFLTVIGVVAAVAGTVYGSTILGDHLNPKKNQVCQTEQRSDHTVTIQNDKVTPKNTVASQCDRLTITNLDDKTRLMAFGLHEAHVPYDGIVERALSKGQSLTVTLLQTGNFRFHDHIHDDIQGTFTVNTR